MPIDASIYGQFTRPVKSVQDYMAEDDQRQSNQLLQLLRQQQVQQGKFAIDKAQRDEQYNTNKLNFLRGLPGDLPEPERVNRMRSAGYYDDAAAFEKSVLERDKTRSQIDAEKSQAAERDAVTLAKHLTVMKDLAGQVFALPTQQAALAALDTYERETGRKAPEQRALLATLQTPDDIKRWAAGLSMQADKLLPQIMSRNTGGTTDTLAVDPVTSETRVAASVPNTVTPGDALSSADREKDRISRERQAAADRARMASDAAAGRAVTMRGQDMTNARELDKIKQAAIAAGEKPLTETQSKDLLFGSRMRAANQIIDDLAAKGTTANISGMDAGMGIGRAITALSSAQQQQLNQAKRDWINAVLRKESGAVIGKEEFDSGDRQYFPQIGDSKAVIEQKRQNRILAEQGVLSGVPENRRDSIVPTTARPNTPQRQSGTVDSGWSVKQVK